MISRQEIHEVYIKLYLFKYFIEKYNLFTQIYMHKDFLSVHTNQQHIATAVEDRKVM